MLLSIRQNGTKKDMVVFLSAATQQSCSPREHSPRPWKCPQELERVLGSSQPITGSWIPQIQNITPGGSITQVPLEFWIHIHQPVRDPAFPSTHNILLFHVLSCGNSFSVNKQTSLFLWLPTLPLWGYNKSFISFLINAHFFMIIYAPCPWICNPWTLFHIPLEMYSETQNEESNRNGVCWQGVLQDAGTSHAFPSTPLCVFMLNCSSGWWLGHLVKLCWPEEDWQEWNVTNDIGCGYCHALIQDLGVEIALYRVIWSPVFTCPELALYTWSSPTCYTMGLVQPFSPSLTYMSTLHSLVYPDKL